MKNNTLAIQYNEEHSEKLYHFCEPLFPHCNIKTFGYRKFFINGEYIALCNHHAWQRFYFENIHNTGEVFSAAICSAPHKKFTYFLWPQNFKTDHIISALHSFDIWNGITIYYRGDDYIESFAFAGDHSSTQIPNFIINNIPFIEKFLLYFKNKTQEIISPYRKDILVKFKEVENFNYKDHNNFKLTEIPASEQDLIFIDGDKVIKFTRKETQCIEGLSKGLTYKCIANRLGISDKTVETHINNIKLKMGHYSKSEIAKLYHENQKIFFIYK